MSSSSSNANYYISNGIKNLKLNVQVEYIGATAFGNIDNNIDVNIDKLERELSILSTNNKNHDDSLKTQYDNAIISWQQKLIHPLKRATIPKVAITTDRNEQEQTTNNENDQNISNDKTSRIFTYINNELTANKINDSKEISTTSTRIRKRKVAPISTTTLKEPIGLLNSKQQKIHRSIVSLKQEMYIMGYFGPLNKSSDEMDPVDNKILCKIICVNNQKIIFEPDLGIHQIETRYGLYKLTLSINDDIHFNSIIDNNDYINDTNKDIEDESTLFELPNPQKIWIQYLITIDEAINFPNNGVYIEYTFDLPSHVRYAEGYEEYSYGRTQICFTKSENNNDVAKFSFPIEVIFEFNEKSNINCPIKWPHLLIKIISEDYWQRSFVNGYGQLSLPVITGKHFYNIECWRPINPYNHISIMKDYFLGQSIDLNSIENQGITDNCINNNISNVSILSETSGQVTFTIYCVRQSRQFISKEILRSIQYGSLLSKVGINSSLHWRIMKVLMQFEEARRQLINVRSKQLPKL